MTIEWRFKAEYIKNCNCAPGIPCDFKHLSTKPAAAIQPKQSELILDRYF